ncbi:MAG TPA: riboflavin synthase [Candidatus Omnitrophota bacterium]|nr:riboflavin synthase [Candidatus Omnitrophota bacterium]
MFTGIIENLGRVESVKIRGKSARMSFGFQKREKRVAVGESIAVNGVCLTAVEISAFGFSADILPETLAVTNLGQLKRSERVNIERSLRAGSAVGGHFVTGHVDAVGQVAEIERREGNWSLLVKAPKTIISKLAVKGSVTCDGVSLTVQSVGSQTFRTAIIPHTLKVTNLGLKRPGSRINLEVDMLMRYLERTKAPKKVSKLSVQNLKRQGF